jgi:hypothetical protein
VIRRFILPVLLLLPAGLLAPGAATGQSSGGKEAGQRKPRLEWRVEGGADALEPAFHVRLIVHNEIPPTEIEPRLGLVQTVIYLYSSTSSGSEAMERASRLPGLTIDPPDPELSALAGPDATAPRVTTEVPGLTQEQTALALTVGRALRIHGPTEPEDESTSGALRADRADLDERLRWAADTLTLPGQERVLWEGSVPPGTDRIFADYLAIRATRSQVTAGQSQTDVPLQPKRDSGILALPPSQSTTPPPEVSGPLGVLVMRPVGEHVHDLELTRGMLNVVRITAFQEVTGALALRFTVETETLERPAP